jgi:hypothetical protein
MAFNTNTPRLEFTASASQTVFDFNFKIFIDSDIVVYQTPTGQAPDDATDILIETTHYTVAIDGDNGGTVTLVSGATLNDSVTLLRDLPFTRETDYQTGGDLLEATLDEDQDYQTYLSQQLESSKGQFINLPASVQGVSASLPSPIADSYFKWNAAGDGIENDTTIPTNVALAVDSAAAALVSETNAAASEANAAADAAQVVADLIATNQDTIDTAADVITTNANVALTNADVLSTAGSEAATAADAAATAADVLATNADVITTNSNAATTTANVATTNTNVSLTNADVVSTHADVVLTNADVITSTEQADRAESYADSLTFQVDTITS